MGSRNFPFSESNNGDTLFGLMQQPVNPQFKPSITLSSVIETSLTPGLKRNAADADMTEFHSDIEFGPQASKLYSVDHDVASNVVKDGYVLNSDNEDEDIWMDSKSNSSNSFQSESYQSPINTSFNFESNKNTEGIGTTGKIMKLAKRRLKVGMLEESWEMDDDANSNPWKQSTFGMPTTSDLSWDNPIEQNKK